jgi:hypothetical protein
VPRPLNTRPYQKLIYCDPNGDEDNDDGFTARPADDIPRNKLTDKLTRGIQSFVQRMQKREGFRIKVTTQPVSIGHIPAPRECGTLTNTGQTSILIGGNSTEMVQEIS